MRLPVGARVPDEEQLVLVAERRALTARYEGVA